MPGVRLLNNGEPTHRGGGRLDLSFITEELCEGSTWEVHPTLTSDHFAVQTNLTLREMPPPPPPPKRWNHSKADLPKFKHSINEWIATYRPAEDIDQLEKDFGEALQNAADASIPTVVPTSHQHKDNWYYCPEIKELSTQMNKARKIFRRNRTEENYELLKEVVTHVSAEMDAIRHDKWLEWCASLNEHTQIGNLWRDLRRIAGKRIAAGRHQEPLEQANRLAGVFAGRTSSENLPPATKRMQERVNEGRWERIEAACYLLDDTDCPFTIEELRRCKHKRKDTAPGADGISYSMIANMGPGAEILFLGLISKTWDEKKRSMAWNDQDFQPIPKPKDPMNPRPITLLSVLGKTAEKMVLARAKWKVGGLHTNLYAYIEGKSKTQCITDILATVKNKKATVLFLDLEKAFELANPAAILEMLVEKRAKGKLLLWIKNNVLRRRGRVKFHGVASDYKELHNGTSQGGIRSPFLFNVLMENIAKLALPRNVKIFIFTDDITVVITSNNQLMDAQEALNTIERAGRCGPSWSSLKI